MGVRQSSISGNSPLLDIPDDLIIEILKWVPARDIVRNCVLVSRQLHDVIGSPTLWRLKSEMDKRYVQGLTPVPADFKRLYFNNPYARNLIRNPCAQGNFQFWDVVQEGGDDFKVENDSNGSQKIPDTEIITEWHGHGPIKNWATSYGVCEKRQRIDLLKEGLEMSVLDDLKIPIYISEWYAARFDCACHYELEVTLLSQNKQVLERFFFEDEIPQWTDGHWTKVEHIFENYKPGVRFVEFRHMGLDRQFWAGHYGSKFTMSTVKFHLTRKT